jgi:hypothetical protein
MSIGDAVVSWLPGCAAFVESELKRRTDGEAPTTSHTRIRGLPRWQSRMTVSRPELSSASQSRVRVRRRPIAQWRRGFSFVAPARPPLALALHASFAVEWYRRVSGVIQAVLVMSPQANPQSSRATAVAATCDFFPRPTRRVYLLNSRV